MQQLLCPLAVCLVVLKLMLLSRATSELAGRGLSILSKDTLEAYMAYCCWDWTADLPVTVWSHQLLGNPARCNRTHESCISLRRLHILYAQYAVLRCWGLTTEMPHICAHIWCLEEEGSSLGCKECGKLSIDYHTLAWSPLCVHRSITQVKMSVRVKKRECTLLLWPLRTTALHRVRVCNMFASSTGATECFSLLRSSCLCLTRWAKFSLILFQVWMTCGYRVSWVGRVRYTASVADWEESRGEQTSVPRGPEAWFSIWGPAERAGGLLR